MSENRRVSTSDRLRSLMAERHLRQVDVLEMLRPYADKHGVRFQKNDLSAYVNGKYLPTQEKLYILGAALNVNEAWLMGYDVPRERQKSAPEGSVPPERDEIATIFASLSDENQNRLIDFARVLLVAQRAECDSQA